MLRLLSLLVFAISGFSVMAATPYKRTLTVKSNTYMRDGVFVGGKAGGGSSLLGVRRDYSAKAKIERVIVDIGDQHAKPAGLSPGYFQVSMDAPNNRVVMDLAQLRLSKISEVQLQNLFSKSPNVVSASLTLDPEDKSGTMVLNLRRPMRLEVFQLLDKKKPGRVVIDLVPLPAASAMPRTDLSRRYEPGVRKPAAQNMRKPTARATEKKKRAPSGEAFF